MRANPVRSFGVVLGLAIISAFVLSGCGGGSIMTGQPAPGNFTNSSLMGNYSFQYQGSDVKGAPFVAAGQFAANGGGMITGGAIDLNDVEDGILLSPSASSGSILNTSTYTVSSDGETVVTLQTNSGLPPLVLQVTLTSSSHGLLTAFDANFGGTGTIDLQNNTALIPTNVAFAVSGVDLQAGLEAVIAGNLTVNSTTITSGSSVVDIVAPGVSATPDEHDTTFSGSIMADAANPGRSVVTLVSNQDGVTVTFAAYVVDNTEVNLAEIDVAAPVFLLGGQGFAAPGLGNQTLNGNYAFTASGEAGNNFASFTAGGVFTASSTAITGGEVDVHSTQVFPVATLTNKTYSSDATFARIDMTLSQSNGSFEYIAYPTNENSLLMIEIDNAIFSNATAYKQSTTTAPTGSFAVDVGGIAFTKSKIAFSQDAVGQIIVSGTGVTGLLQINNFQTGNLLPNVELSSSTISSTDQFGRGSNLTLEGSGISPYMFAYYTVDGSRVLTVEIDNKRLGTGELLVQPPTP